MYSYLCDLKYTGLDKTVGPNNSINRLRMPKIEKTSGRLETIGDHHHRVNYETIISAWTFCTSQEESLQKKQAIYYKFRYRFLHLVFYYPCK